MNYNYEWKIKKCRSPMGDSWYRLTFPELLLINSTAFVCPIACLWEFRFLYYLLCFISGPLLLYNFVLCLNSSSLCSLFVVGGPSEVRNSCPKLKRIVLYPTTYISVLWSLHDIVIIYLIICSLLYLCTWRLVICVGILVTGTRW